MRTDSSATARRGRAYAVVVALVVTGVLAGGVLLPAPAGAVPAPTASPSPSRAATRYYVVGKPANGHREYLFDIAAKTLGDGKRYLEIFRLNKGRLQPDGRRMADPTVVEPGWVLLLPEDAKGPGVKVGPMPTPHTRTGATAVQTPRRTAAEPVGMMGQTIALAALIALSVLVWWVLRVLRRTRPSLPLLNLVGADGPVGVWDQPDPQTDPPAAVPRGLSGSERPDPRPAEYDPPALGQSSDPSHTAPLAVQVATPTSPQPGVLRTEVVAGDEAVSVRLAGVRDTSASGWVLDVRPPADAAALVVLGENDQGTLYVDLALAPDVVTVTGSPESRQRQALSLARQLVEAGVTVTAVGNPFGASGPPGCRSVPTVDDAIEEATGGGLRVLFHARDPRDDTELAAIRRALSLQPPRLVPVLVGDVRPGRWSIDVRPQDTGDPGFANANGRTTGLARGQTRRRA